MVLATVLFVIKYVTGWQEAAGGRDLNFVSGLKGNSLIVVKA